MSVIETTKRNGKVVKIERVHMDDSRTEIFSEKEHSIRHYVIALICFFLPLAIVLILLFS